MEILKYGDKRPVTIAFDCLNCGCEFICGEDEYEVRNDSKNDILYKSECPCCHHHCWRKAETVEEDKMEGAFTEEEDCFTLSNPPCFPQDFYDFTGGVEQNNQTINKWIQNAADYFFAHPDETLYFIASGDSILFAVNYEDGLHLYVAKGYYEANIF